MPEIGLQAYIDEAKELVRSGGYEEAIAICRHILKQYPKHIESYRVLAEACLEKGEHEEALDLFKRVLSADPENFISYVGVGIIYDEDGLLDEATWQFERAFEISPGNAEVRRELKRLYTQRDGVEQPRLKLNRAALGRLYSKGGFYNQAISEFREILKTDPERIDTQLALSEALWYNAQRREAADVCQDVLNKLPHCLKSNLILGEIWLGSGLEEEGNTLLHRAQTLDPENLLAIKLFGDRSPLPYQEIKIPRLGEHELAEEKQALAAERQEAEQAEESEDAEDWLSDLQAPALQAGEIEEQGTGQEEVSRMLSSLKEEPEPDVAAATSWGEQLAEQPSSAAPERRAVWGEDESPVVASLEQEFGALPEVTAAEISDQERQAILADMPPENASLDEIMAWLRRRQESAGPEAPAEQEPVQPREQVTAEEAQPDTSSSPEEASPELAAREEEFVALPEQPEAESLSMTDRAETPPEPAQPRASAPEEESPVIAALELEFGALPEMTTAEVDEQQRQALLADMPPEDATPEQIMAWVRRQQSGAAALPAATAATPEEDKPEWLASVERAWEQMPETAEETSPTAEGEPVQVPAEEERLAAVDVAALEPLTAADAEGIPSELVEELPIEDLPRQEAPLVVLEATPEETPAVSGEALPAEEAATVIAEATPPEAQPVSVEEMPREEMPRAEQALEQAPSPLMTAPPEETAAEPALETAMQEPVAVAEAEPEPAAAVIESPAQESAEALEVEPEGMAPVAETPVEPAAVVVEAEQAEAEPELVGASTAPDEVAVEQAPEAVVAEADPTALYLARLETAPDDQEARLLLARVYAQRQEWDKSAEQYGQLVQSSTGLEQVLADLSQLTEAHPDQLALQQLLGDAYMEAGQYEQALAKYNWLLGQV